MEIWLVLICFVYIGLVLFCALISPSWYDSYDIFNLLGEWYKVPLRTLLSRIFNLCFSILIAIDRVPIIKGVLSYSHTSVVPVGGVWYGYYTNNVAPQQNWGFLLKSIYMLDSVSISSIKCVMETDALGNHICFCHILLRELHCSM